jgi:hypothetical protein
MKYRILMATLLIQTALISSPVSADDSLMDVSPDGAGTGQMGHQKKKVNQLHQEAIQACQDSKVKACVRTYEGSIESCLKTAGVELPKSSQPLPASETAAVNQCKRQALWAL